MHNPEICKRFGLISGQFFGFFRYKNLQWFLNDQRFGFGDLRDADISRIRQQLKEGELFEGYNEHHGTPFQQLNQPMITITRTGVNHLRERPRGF